MNYSNMRVTEKRGEKKRETCLIYPRHGKA